MLCIVFEGRKFWFIDPVLFVSTGAGSRFQSMRYDSLLPRQLDLSQGAGVADNVLLIPFICVIFDVKVKAFKNMCIYLLKILRRVL